MTAALTWEQLLADMAARVELAEDALDEGVDLDPSLLVPWMPPEGLGPLPEHLQERAMTVLRAQAELELRLQTAADQLRREATRINQGASNLSAYGESVIPKYFD